MYHPVGLFSMRELGRSPIPYKDLELDIPSTWLVAPYFMLYFIMYIINSVVWPMQLMERACITLLPAERAIKYKFDSHGFNQVSNSCISYYVSQTNDSDSYIVRNANSITLNMMILAAFGGGVVSLLSYFLIWKPLLTRCRSIAVFLPPVCLIAQAFILIQAQSMTEFEQYKYTVLSGVLLPSLHANFQGVLLQLYHMSNIPEVKTNRELMHTRLDASHLVIFIAIAFAGAFVAGIFDLSYNLVFFLQFTLGSVNVMYGVTLLPTDGPCMSGVEEENENDEGGEQKEKEDAKTVRKMTGHSSDSSEEEFFLGDVVKNQKVNLLKEAPMIFSETSYKMELIVIIEISVFTAAMLSDTSLGGLYFIESKFPFDLKIFGACIAAQGLVKTIGMLFMKFVIRFTQIKHGTLIGIALTNYIGYYVALSLASSKIVLMVVMFTNVFGGLALPTIFSFMKINFKETAETVLEISLISSLVVAMGFNALELFLYEKTRAIFPGAVFAVTASLLAICGIIIVATYFSTSKKNQRKSKFFADQLLNNNN